MVSGEEGHFTEGGGRRSEHHNTGEKSYFADGTTIRSEKGLTQRHFHTSKANDRQNITKYRQTRVETTVTARTYKTQSSSYRASTLTLRWSMPSWQMSACAVEEVA
jgi:hypothetical protein